MNSAWQNKRGKIVGKEELELRLAIFDSIREPGRCYTQTAIAAACGVSRTLIWQYEKRALAKLRREADRRRLEEAA